MKVISFFAVGLLAATLLSCGGSKPIKSQTKNIKQTQNSKHMENLTPKKLAIKAMNAFFRDYDSDGVQKYFAENYIQHNPHVPTGIKPVLAFLAPLKEAGTTFKTHRILQDGNIVVMHNSYDNAEAFGAKEMVTFDVYRIENNKIAEHWDALSPRIKETASGRSQVDGVTKVTDLGKTETNKKLIEDFLSDVMFGKKPEKITEYISAETYHQHNIAIKDGLEGLNDAIKYLESQNDMFTYQKVHKILGEGNFVLTICEGEWHGRKQSFYDLFRIENKKIVEHWDIIQEIPEQMAHENGMF